MRKFYCGDCKTGFNFNQNKDNPLVVGKCRVCGSYNWTIEKIDETMVNINFDNIELTYANKMWDANGVKFPASIDNKDPMSDAIIALDIEQKLVQSIAVAKTDTEIRDWIDNKCISNNRTDIYKLLIEFQNWIRGTNES